MLIGVDGYERITAYAWAVPHRVLSREVREVFRIGLFCGVSAAALSHYL